jgi:hypothetical protein
MRRETHEKGLRNRAIRCKVLLKRYLSIDLSVRYPWALHSGRLYISLYHAYTHSNITGLRRQLPLYGSAPTNNKLLGLCFLGSDTPSLHALLHLLN